MKIVDKLKLQLNRDLPNPIVLKIFEYLDLENDFIYDDKRNARHFTHMQVLAFIFLGCMIIISIFAN